MLNKNRYPGYYGTVGSDRLGTCRNFLESAKTVPESRRAVPEPIQISTDPVAGMIDLGRMSSDTDVKLDSYLEAIQNHIKSANYDSAEKTLFEIRELMRTKKIINISNDVDLKLRKFMAIAFDHKNSYIQAVRCYYILSMSPMIEEQKSLHLLTDAIKCTVLSGFGVARSELISVLFKNEKAKRLPLYSIVDLFFKKRLILLSKFENYHNALYMTINKMHEQHLVCSMR
ncbi:unnamed protein product [Adineta ricciae]|uniref:Uncharacterized protein n=1 Tax=Adineta ricciae TaxID=249248 RepID=A0A814T2P4_ADIRI|nr:unnamed protein product [Adineta ricciae]